MDFSTKRKKSTDTDPLMDEGQIDELAAPGPVDVQSRHESWSGDRHSRRMSKLSKRKSNGDEFINLSEFTAPSPVDNPKESHQYRHEFLEDHHSSLNRGSRGSASGLFNFVNLELSEEPSPIPTEPEQEVRASQTAPEKRAFTPRIILELSVLSYLVLFSILGTLARLGLQVLTSYPGAPITTSAIWANVGGSCVMGYLSEDRQLFKSHIEREATSSKDKVEDSGNSASISVQDNVNPGKAQAQAAKNHMTMKKSIPLYIGLTTGFCGSFTTFSSFIRDVFLQLADQPLAVKPRPVVSEDMVRSGGDSAMAVIAIIFLTIGLSISALKVGAHLAIAVGDISRSLPSWLTSEACNCFMIALAACMWTGAIIIVIWPPDDTWRGQVLFALVFAPAGTITRFYISVLLNGVIASFPLGTFAVNIFGTAVLGMSWDLQRAPLLHGMIGGGKLECQMLQGVEDGFCGCLTTVSTWGLELVGLKRKHAYIYGGFSVAVSLAFLVVIMGSLLWTKGFESPACIT